MPRRTAEGVREKRANYTFDCGQLAQLKELVKLLTTPTNPVTVSKLLKEAVADLLLKYAHSSPNGTGPKTKPATASH